MIQRILILLGVPAILFGGLAMAVVTGMIGRPITAELKKIVVGEKLQNARIIVREFNAAGIPPAVTLAALTNSYAESRWDNRVIGDNGHSVGLFQLNDAKKAAGYGMSIEERQDPVKNSRRILEVLGTDGQEILRQERMGASIATLAGLYSKHVERPKDEAGEMAKRADLARELWGDAADRAGPLVGLPASLLE